MSATELEGKPLKFTALFDSKEAETKLSDFLKKVEAINTKGVGSGASKSINKASGQYKSILEGVNQSFGEFIQSNQRFYAGIAQSEMGLQKVRNEQSILNAELRKGLVTEEEYINKTSQLTQLRERLSQTLKDNKQQLQQFNNASASKPAFTRQDTLSELVSAHGAKNAAISMTPASEAIARATQEAINKLNAELVDLDNKLKSGSITNEQYAKSASAINEKIKETVLNQEQFGQSFTSTSEDMNKQKTVLDAISSEYKELVSEASSAFDSLSPKVKGLNNNLVQLREENKRLTGAQKDLDTSFKTGSITQSQYIEATRNISVQQSAVRSRIAETRKELSQLDSLESKSIGSIAEKTARLTQLKQRYDQLSESQRNNINIGGRLEKEYQDLNKEVGKLNSNLVGTKSGGIGAMFSSIQGIAGALGIAFGVGQLVSFGKELFNIAKQAEGVTMAFNRMSGDSSANLEKLRVATKRTVSDLELMKLAVRAENFKIPLDVLAKGLQFARQRANDTGQSVDYLVNSFVDGIGRQSKLVLDNLGISANELSKEIEKTGDFAKAAGNIIDKEFAKAGGSVDTLADRVDQVNTKWQNLKLTTSSYFKGLMFDITALLTSNSWKELMLNVTKLTSNFGVKDISATVIGGAIDGPQKGNTKRGLVGYKDMADFRKMSVDQQKKEIEAQKELVKVRVTEYNLNKDNVKMRDDMLFQQEKLAKMYSETNKAQAKSIGNTTAELGLIEKAKSEIEDLQKLRDKSTSKDDISKYTTQINAKQKELDLLLGNNKKTSDERAAEKLKEQIKKDKEEFEKLVKESGTLAGKFTIEIVTPEQAEINKVIDEYDKLIEKAIEHNKTSKSADRIDIGALEVEKGLSVNRTIERLEKAEKEKSDKENEKKQKENYDKMLTLSKNALTEEIAIRTKYQDAYEVLENEKTKITEAEYEARKGALKRAMNSEINDLFSKELEGSSEWTDVFTSIMKKTASGAEKAIADLKVKVNKLLKDGKINIHEYNEALEKIQNVEINVTTKSGAFGDLKAAIKLYKEAEGLEKKEALSQVAQIANGYFQRGLGALQEMGGVMDQLGIGSERFKENFAETIDLLGNAGNLATSIMSGDLMGMITNGVKTLSSALNLFSKDKKFERQIKAYQEQLDGLEKSFRKISDLINNSVGESFYSDSKNAINNLKERQRILNEMAIAEESKKKTDKNKVKGYRDEISAIDDEIKEIQKSISEMLIQTTFKDFANELTNAIVSAFEAGEDAIGAMDKTFDKFIKNALVNSLKLKIVEEQVKKMTDELTLYMQNNDNSLDGFNFNYWKEQLKVTSDKFTNELEKAYSGLKLEKDGDSNSSLKAEEGITRRSESTGTEIVGTFRAGYDQWKLQTITLQSIDSKFGQYLIFSNEKLAALNAIQVNTANTVLRLDQAVTELQGIRQALR